MASVVARGVGGWLQLVRMSNKMSLYKKGGFLNWWHPTTMGFPTGNDHFGVFWGVLVPPSPV